MKADAFTTLIAHIKDASRIVYRGLEYGAPSQVSASTVRGLIEGVQEMDNDRQKAMRCLFNASIPPAERIEQALAILRVDDTPVLIRTADSGVPVADIPFVSGPGVTPDEPASTMETGGSAE